MSSTTAVAICNDALVRLGIAISNKITALGDGTKLSDLCNQVYDESLEQELRAHAWNFAKARVQLATSTAATTVSGFDFLYERPSDFLRTLRLHDSDADVGRLKYEMIGTRIATDSNQAYLTYVQDQTDVTTFDPLFRNVLSWRIAAELAIAVTGSTRIMDEMWKGYRRAVRKARSVDAIEDFPEEQPESSWSAIRGQGRSTDWGVGD